MSQTGQGTSKARVHDVFKTRVTELAEQSKAMSKAFLENAQMKWMLPDGLQDPSVHEDVNEKFDRNEISSNYLQCIESGDSPGTVGDVISLNMQGDYISAMERGFRARWANPARLFAHAVGRRKGHGHTDGVLLGAVIGYAQDAITSGQG